MHASASEGPASWPARCVGERRVLPAKLLTPAASAAAASRGPLSAPLQARPQAAGLSHASWGTPVTPPPLPPTLLQVLRTAAARNTRSPAAPCRRVLRLQASALFSRVSLALSDGGEGGDAAQPAADAAADAAPVAGVPAPRQVKRAGPATAAVKARCKGTLGTWCADYWTQAEVPAVTAPRGSKNCSLNCNQVGTCSALSGLCTCPAGARRPRVPPGGHCIPAAACRPVARPLAASTQALPRLSPCCCPSPPRSQAGPASTACCR